MRPFANRGESHVRLQLNTALVRMPFPSLGASSPLLQPPRLPAPRHRAAARSRKARASRPPNHEPPLTAMHSELNRGEPLCSTSKELIWGANVTGRFLSSPMCCAALPLQERSDAQAHDALQCLSPRWKKKCLCAQTSSKELPKEPTQAPDCGK